MSLGGSPKFIRCSALKIGGLTGAMDQFASKWNCEELCIRYVSGQRNPKLVEFALTGCNLKRYRELARLLQ
jgi:hypothetical protein